MGSLRYPLTGASPARCLVVLLPGMGDSAAEYEQRGFIEEVRRRPLSIDLIAANATFGYYSRRSVVDRLAEDVIGPARARGYQQVWLVGISMGGLGTLLYAHQHPDQIDGLVLLAPYLGDDALLDEIRGAGGMRAWKPGPPVSGDYQRELWRWLQGITLDRAGKPRLYLGAGDDDKLRKGQRILEEGLAPDHVSRTEGGHDWPPWRRLWVSMLTHSELSAACAVPGP